MNNKIRQAIVANANWLIDRKKLHPSQFGYGDKRPENYIMKKDALQALFDKGQKISPDCSGMTTLLFYMSGANDPTGQKFDNFGNSELMWSTLKHHYNTPTQALPGALVVYGNQGQIHVATVIGDTGTTNPILFSHGSDKGPIAVKLFDEDNAHAGQTRTFLDVSKL